MKLPPENPAAHAVANGEAEIGMTQISEILPYAGAELVGPLPAEIQLTSSFATAAGANAARRRSGESADQVHHRASRRRGVQGEGARSGVVVADQAFVARMERRVIRGCLAC